MINGMERRGRLLSVQELSDYLGVPVATLYQWRYRREGPPGFRVGRHVRYCWSDVEGWIEQQVKASKSTALDHALFGR
ncbi:MAG TPA: helix-turn-helix domain-containing protein [Acidimicrobiia bacterium]|nr:helix-turn-helix domain-containing protein [Acidimicrobiia bacterium]